MKFGPLRAISAALLLFVAQRCRIWLFQGSEWWPETQDAAVSSEAWIAGRRRALVKIREIMEDPELYYDDQGGDGDGRDIGGVSGGTDGDGGDGEDDGSGPRRWIWSARSTVPRDVLLAAERPPLLHLVVTVHDIPGMVESADRFFSHYGDLGVTPDRMVFDIRRTPIEDEAGRAGEAEVYRRLLGVISTMGADYSTSYAGAGEEASYREEIEYISLLAAMRGLPLNDWILMVRGAELVLAGGSHCRRKNKEAAIWEFLDECERDGVNSAWAVGAAGCHGAERLVAVRGYLRPDPKLRRALSIQEAEELFDGSFYLSYSPYYRFWELYKSRSVVGNAYLWQPRGSSADNALRIL